VDVNAVYEEGATLLHKAALEGNVIVIKFLVSKGANVNAKTNSRLTPLYLAMALNKNTEVAECLISTGADVNDGATLYTAIAEEKIEACKFLISKGTNVNAKIHDGATPLHLATLKGNIEFAKVFISARADVNAKDNSGSTPLHIAAFCGKLELAKFLISNGADLFAKTNNGKTPQDMATQAGKTEMFLYLVDALLDNADRQNTNRKLRGLGLSNPTFTAAEQAEINRFLTKFQTNADTVDVKATYEGGLTLLHVAAHQEGIAVVKFLVAKGALLNAKEKNGLPPLFFALTHDKITEVAEFLVSVGANVKDDTTMRAFVAQGKNEAVNFLVSKGAKAVHANSNTTTTLGCLAGVSTVVGFLLMIGGGLFGYVFDGHAVTTEMQSNGKFAFGVGLFLSGISIVLWWLRSRYSSQCPSCKQFSARELTKTTTLGSQVVQREENEVIGETRNSKGEVIAQQTRRVQYNVRVTTKENEYKCKHCGYEWKGPPYNEEVRIS